MGKIKEIIMEEGGIENAIKEALTELDFEPQLPIKLFPNPLGPLVSVESKKFSKKAEAYCINKNSLRRPELIIDVSEEIIAVMEAAKSVRERW